MNELRFGTAGIPYSTKEYHTLEGIKRVAELGLGAMELEFVRNVNIKKDFEKIRKTAEQENVILTCHGQYFINLNAEEKKKIEESKARILHAARTASACGAWSLCFHAGYYLKKSQSATFLEIKKHLKILSEQLIHEGNKIWLRPETSGKLTQFGDLDEILALSAELENVLPCIDFSHLHARAGGKFNTYHEFWKALSKVEMALGKKGTKQAHIHLAGIEYSPKGERRHLNLQDSDINYEELLAAFKDFKIAGVVICESPDTEGDAKLLQHTYNSLHQADPFEDAMRRLEKYDKDCPKRSVKTSFEL